MKSENVHTNKRVVTNILTQNISSYVNWLYILAENNVFNMTICLYSVTFKFVSNTNMNI